VRARFLEADPFAPFMQSSSAAPDKAIDLVLPLEERELHTDKINLGCIRNCFPRAWLAPERQRVYANVSVICSGAIFGTPTGFELLAQLLVPLAAMCRLDKMSDQAALNFLIYYSPALEVYAVHAPRWADGSQTLPDGRVGALLFARAHTSLMPPGFYILRRDRPISAPRVQPRGWVAATQRASTGACTDGPCAVRNTLRFTAEPRAINAVLEPLDIQPSWAPSRATRSAWRSA
jgi:hypothetical protein